MGKTISNVQIKILKLYSTDLSSEELLELKKVLAKYFADKAVNGANEIWKSRGLTDNDMENWLSE